MPRWPAGLHPAAQSIRAVGTAPYRATATGQENYWRHTVAELRTGATVNYALPLGGSNQPPPPNPAFAIQASVAPQGTGERWLVDVVRVVTGSQVGQPPLVVQQVAAQVLGTTTSPPPPIVAQVWLSIGGQNIHLLSQTTQGGNDDLSIGGQPVAAGEAITVIWYGLNPLAPTSAWFTVRGTKLALDT